MTTIQRTYTVPLRSGYVNHATWKRSNKAVSVLRIFLQKHTKRKDVKLGMDLNEFIWKHGIKNPPHHIKVDVWIEEDHAKAELSGHTYREAIKPEKKKEDKGLKDKLAKKMGVDLNRKKEDKAAEKSEKQADSKPEKSEEKAEGKPAKKEESKPAAKPVEKKAKAPKAKKPKDSK